ncbi:MAG: HAD family hydrolase [Pseudomonadota bacterium]
MVPTLVAFDFDGTLTWTDTFAAFLAHAAGKKAFWAAIRAERRMLGAHLAGRVENATAKVALMERLIGGRSRESLEAAAAEFLPQMLERHINPVAKQAFEAHRQAGDRCIIVSASLEITLRPIADHLGADELVATRLIEEKGAVTGRLEGGNCWGPEKAHRLRALLDRDGPHKIIAYGDSRGDLELLSMAEEGHYRPFRGPAHGRKATAAFLKSVF